MTVLDQIRFTFWVFRSWLAARAEKFIDWLAWRLPRRLVLACSIRLMVNATIGPYEHELTPGVTCVDALKRWKV